MTPAPTRFAMWLQIRKAKSRTSNATNSRATPRPRSQTIPTQVNPAPSSIPWPHCAWLIKRNPSRDSGYQQGLWCAA